MCDLSLCLDQTKNKSTHCTDISGIQVYCKSVVQCSACLLDCSTGHYVSNMSQTFLHRRIEIPAY